MILDSNILIYFANPGFDKLRSYLKESQNTIYVSLISKLEVLGYHRLKLADKIELERLLGAASILPITDAIITEAIRLRQQRKRSLGDSLIAATALLHELPLLTNNTADFEDIPGLRVISYSRLLKFFALCLTSIPSSDPIFSHSRPTLPPVMNIPENRAFS